MGLVSGSFGGLLDNIIMRLLDIQLSFPAIILYIAVMDVLGPGLVNIILVLGVVGWSQYARIVRSKVLALHETEFITASASIWRQLSF